MGNNFGTIAIKSMNWTLLKKRCAEWKQKGWLFGYEILKGDLEWISIFDEIFECGNMDVYVSMMFSDIENTVLSVEYEDETVRYRLWERGECVGEKCIGCQEEPCKNKDNIITLFASKLQANEKSVFNVFAAPYPEQSLDRMERLLQCPLWKNIGQETIDKRDLVECNSEKEQEKSLNRKREMAEKMSVETSWKVQKKRLITVTGSMINNDGDIPVYFDENEERGKIYFMNENLEFQKAIDLPAKLFSDVSFSKFYFGKGLIGFLSKQNDFHIYQNNQLQSRFPDIIRCIMPPWQAFMYNENLIFMEWACYEAKTGVKKWEFPLPLTTKSYKKFLLKEMWYVLPTQLILTQVNLDQEKLYLSIMDQEGEIKASTYIEINYDGHKVGVGRQYIYVLKRMNGSKGVEILLYDFDLNPVGRYSMDVQPLDYKLCFSRDDRYFFLKIDKRILQMNIKNGKAKEYILPYNDVDTTDWGVLESGIIYFIVKMRELHLFQLESTMDCFFKHKFKGYYLKIWNVEYNRIVVISTTSQKQEKLNFQEFVILQQ